MSDHVEVSHDREAHLTIVRLIRPEARNAVNGEMAAAIEAALDVVEDDAELWATVITGTAEVFCSGGDLAEVAAGSSAMRTRRGGFAGIVRRERRVPLIAAVEGPAVGGGLEIVLAADLAVAGRSARFGLPEVKRSLLAAAGGLFRLGQVIPPRLAMEWALTGDLVGAERAYELGLLNAVVEDGAALGAALALAARVTANAPLAVQLSREVMRAATGLPDEQAWEINRDAMRRIGRTADFREGLDAFTERRTPRWTGT